MIYLKFALLWWRGIVHFECENMSQLCLIENMFYWPEKYGYYYKKVFITTPGRRILSQMVVRGKKRCDIKCTIFHHRLVIEVKNWIARHFLPQLKISTVVKSEKVTTLILNNNLLAFFKWCVSPSFYHNCYI